MDDDPSSFLRTQSEDEALPNNRAVVAGLQASLSHLIERLAGYHSLLELELDGNPAGQLYIKGSETAVTSARSLLSVSEQLLPNRDAFETVELTALLRGVVARLAKIGRAQMTVSFAELEDEQLFLWGDLQLLQRMFFNLPLLLMSGHGPNEKIAVTVQLDTLDQDFLSARKSASKAGEHAILNLSKQGDAPADLSNLVTISEKQVVSDTFRLSDRFLFVYGAFLLHGGDLFCAKQAEELDTLVGVLPLQRHQTSMYQSKGVEKSELRGTETVLLVDDEGIIWDVVIDMLQSLGYTVILAPNGKDCVEIYRENPGAIDLVLLDMVMPEMNGRDAFFALHNIDPNVSVLLSSGYMAEEDARDVLAAGAAGFLKKPYRLVDLAQAIRSCLSATKA